MQAPLNTEELTSVLNLLLSRFAPASANLQPYSVEEVTQYQQEVLVDPKKLRDQLMAHRPAVSDTTVNIDLDN